MAEELKMRVRVWLDEKMAVAWIYHIKDDDIANDRIMDVCLVSKSAGQFMRIGNDGVASRSFKYDWCDKVIQL